MEDRPIEPAPRSIAVASASPSGGDDVADREEEEAEFEFQFPFVSRDGGGAYSPALADDLFVDGRIRPFVYPVFGRRGTGAGGGDGSSTTAPVDDVAAPAVVVETRRVRGQLGRLFLEESRERMSSSSTSSSADEDGGGMELEGAPAPETYCVWTPGCSGSPRPPPRKSGSTGSSMARWRRISDLVVGRSHSDGKEKFLFLPVTPPLPPKQQQPAASTKPRRPTRPSASAGAGGGGGGKKQPPPPPPRSEISTVAAAHRISYGSSTAKAAAAVTPRRTFLPYREDLVGFFANVHGISRSHPHPY